MAAREKKHIAIKDFKTGDKITDFFMLRKKELKTKKDGTPYISLELGDATGRIQAACWDHVKTVYDQLSRSKPVKVQGTVIEYHESLQLSIEKIRAATAADKIDNKDFLPRTHMNIEDMRRHLKEIIDSVSNPYLYGLLTKTWMTKPSYEQFGEAPGGKLWHHAFLGGLIEHTIAVATICEHMTNLYPDLNRDLLICGAILHDLGKVETYVYEQGWIDFSDRGRLLGHIAIGAQRVQSMIDEFRQQEEFPKPLEDALLHLILSHQGTQEHGSPVVPMTREAMLLYYADEMDSKLNAIKHVIERDTDHERQWSRYVPPLDRFIYLDNEPTTLE